MFTNSFHLWQWNLSYFANTPCSKIFLFFIEIMRDNSSSFSSFMCCYFLCQMWHHSILVKGKSPKIHNLLSMLTRVTFYCVFPLKEASAHLICTKQICWWVWQSTACHWQKQLLHSLSQDDFFHCFEQVVQTHAKVCALKVSMDSILCVAHILWSHTSNHSLADVIA